MDANKLAIKLLGSIVPLLCCVAGAGAQTVMDGTVSISNLAVSRAKDKLFVSMDVDVSAVEMKSNRELLLTPTLAASGDSLRLPSMLLAGRNRYYHHLRNGLSSDAVTLYRYGTVKTIEYRSVISYEKWMGRAVMRIGGEICGCCDETLAVEDDRLTRLDLEPGVFVPQFVYIRPEAQPKIRMAKGMAYVDFPVNRTELYEDYRRNPTELAKIRTTIDAVREDSDTRILSVAIKGYASPEGPYSGNARLAEGRTETLRRYVQSLYAFPDTLLTTAYEPEDWAGLARYVEGSELENRAGILEIIRSRLSPDDRDRRIRELYPEDYAFLLREVYPALRHSDYVVTYEVRAYTDVEEIRRLLRTQPQKLSLQEMFLAAQETEPGCDEYNEIFEIAVRMFPDDATANLNAANTAMGKGDMKRAQRYLSKAGDTPEAVYARGVHAALSGDYAAAVPLLTEADRQGVAEAAEALRRIGELER